METTNDRNDGYIIECNAPRGLAEALERTGMAAFASRTVDGVYVELKRPLQSVVGALITWGVEIDHVRRAGDSASWQRSFYGSRAAGMRLRCMRTAEWLPTLPAA